MTTLAAPTPIIAAATCRRIDDSGGQLPQQRSATVHAVVSSRRSQLAAAPATTERLLRQRNHVRADDRDRVTLRIASASESEDPERTADTSPLRMTDPVSVNDYRLVSRLGAGGMADVFYALAPTGRPVAIKILRVAGGALESCRREYRLAYAVNADCTPPALGYGMSTAGAYLVTAYLPGYRCGSTLEGRSTPARQLWTLGSALARVLAAVHSRGIVHCDVKPSNLLVRGNDVRVIDFGIARYVGERCGDNGIVQCSRGWAAPEQLRTAPATPAVDVFAWGCVLAYLAGGVHPFSSQSEQEWILRVQSAEPDLFGLPSGLDEVIRWTLARDPRDRPSADELTTICRAHYYDAHDRTTGHG